jgi:hypothetical protein
MDILESCVTKINKEKLKHNDDITKSISDAVYKLSKSSNTINSNIDSKLKRIFNADITKYQETETFCPKYVFDMTDESNIRRYDNYDKVKGLMPNRHVIGKYYVNYYVPKNCPNDYFSNKGKQGTQGYYIVDTNNDDYELYVYMSMNYYNQNRVSSNSEHNIKVVNGGTKLSHFQDLKNHQFMNTLINNPHPCIGFEVDNYLNIRMISMDGGSYTDMYLIYNYTSFPLTAFHTYEHFSKSLNDTSFPFYIKLISGTNKFTEAFIKSIDNEETLFEELKKLKPLNYNQVYESLNSFRELYKLFGDIIIDENNILETNGESINKECLDEEKTDQRDETITTLNKKIMSLMEGNREIKDAMGKMLEEYTEQQEIIKSLRLELNEEKEKSLKSENTTNLELKNEIEQLKTKLMMSYNELIERNEFRQKIETLENSYKTMNANYDTMKLENEKIKNKRDSLLLKIKNQTDTITMLKEQIKELELINDNINKDLEVNKETEKQAKSELINLEKENKELSSMLKKITESNNDGYIESLYESTEEYKNQISTLKDELKELHKTNNALQIRINKYESTLKNLLC